MVDDVMAGTLAAYAKAWRKGCLLERRGLEHKHQEISPGFEGHAGPGGRPGAKLGD